MAMNASPLATPQKGRKRRKSSSTVNTSDPSNNNTADKQSSSTVNTSDPSNSNTADDPYPVDDNRHVNVGLMEDEEDESDDEGVGVIDMLRTDSTYSDAMAALLPAIHGAISIGNKGEMASWLREYLDMNGWWVRACAAKYLCGKLKIEFHESAYYMDTYVWVPDVRFEVLPSCPTCGSNHNVERDGRESKKPARRVIGLHRDYYLMGMRYRCKTCGKKHELLKPSRERKNGVQAMDSLNFVNFFKSAGSVQEYTEAPKQEVADLCDDEMSVDESDSEEEEENDHRGKKLQKSDTSVRYRFNGFDQDSMKWSDFQTHFPAHLTKRLGIDRTLMRMVVASFASGMKSSQIASMILELQTSHHAELWVQYERESMQPKISTNKDEHEQFSRYGDPKKYNGKIRSKNYIKSVYLSYSASIRTHCDKAVKMRSATSIDASYKVPKLLARLNGKALYACLQTGTNEFGEIRVQNLTVTDGHDQMRTPLEAMIQTQKEYNQECITHVTTDKPSHDRNFFQKVFNGVAERQERFNSNRTRDPYELPPPQYDSNDVRVISSSREDMNTACSNILEKAKDDNDTIALDSEWEYNRSGPEKISLIQISYYDGDDGEDTRIKTILFRVKGFKSLPRKLVLLLNTLKLTGRSVGVDVAKIERDFACHDLKENSARVELATMANDRGVVPSASVSLQALTKLVLGEQLDKGLQSSHWSAEELTADQIKYAALDTIVSLRIYTELSKMVDINWRMKVRSEAIVGRLVDVATSHKGEMFGRIATGVVVADTDVNQKLQPGGYSIKKTTAAVKARRVLVKITSVFAKAAIIKYYEKANAAKSHEVTLGELGVEGFTLYVPVKMLCDPLPQSLHPKSNDDSSDVEETPSPNNNDDDGYFDDEPHEKNNNDGVNDDSDDDDSDDDDSDDDDSDDDDSDNGDSNNDEKRKKEEKKKADKIYYDEKLGKRPTSFGPVQAVTGDQFHYSQRANVPMNHVGKKNFFQALKAAFYIEDPADLERVTAALKKDGMSDDLIAGMRKHKQSFFQSRIKRYIPPPKELYARVRAVYEEFGNLRDSKGGAPLFNDSAWKKAKGVLEDISKGYVSDPPDKNYYFYKLDKNGDIARDRRGLFLYTCTRGTNAVENVHKQLVTIFKNWSCGVELTDCLLMNFRHRFNQRASERHRTNFPQIGHYDTWLVDEIQRLNIKNHSVIVYPGWSNASDFADTPERFGTIPIHDKELDKKLRKHMNGKPKPKLTPDQAYAARKSCLPIPFAPVVRPSEMKLFENLYKKNKDPNTMAMDWIDYVDDRKGIFPKLPSHLRQYEKTFKHNTEVKLIASMNVESIAKLQKENEESNLRILKGDDASDNDDMSDDDDGDEDGLKKPTKPFPQPAQCRPEGIASVPQHDADTSKLQFLGMFKVGENTDKKTQPKQKKKRGERGKRKKEGKQTRTCTVCGKKGFNKQNYPEGVSRRKKEFCKKYKK